jgi:altronate dehydratase small subunit
MTHEATSRIEGHLLRLTPEDNVAMALTDLKPGDRIRWEIRVTSLQTPIPLGHKVALLTMAAGSKIIKYGVPIGTLSQEVAFGDHVHTHNLRSDYLPTYPHEDQSEFFRNHP